MLLEFAAITGFSTLFIASIFDLKSAKGDVPEVILFSGIAAGLILHLAYSIASWNPSALIWSFGTGLGFFLYGYFAYRKGMWGGADMLGLTILGVSTPYLLGLFGVMDLLLNTMMVGFLYAVGFGLYGGLKSSEVRGDFINRIKNEKTRFAGLTVFFAAFSAFAEFQGLKGLTYFLSFEGMLIVYYFMVSVEEKLMVRKVKASEVEEGDVLAEGEIKGVEDEDLEDLEGEVTLKKGIRFMPVFPVAMVLSFASFSTLEILILLF